MSTNETATLSPCHWQENDDGIWETACNYTFVFTDNSGPDAHGFAFCPCCGKRVDAKRHWMWEDGE